MRGTKNLKKLKQRYDLSFWVSRQVVIFSFMSLANHPASIDHIFRHRL